MAMPRARASCGLRTCTAWLLKNTLPLPGLTELVMIFDQRGTLRAVPRPSTA